MATLKYSRQRETIKNFLLTRKDHPTADIVYMNVRKQDPNISLGTVYRNLTLLADIGEISRLRVGDGVDHFDADTSPHYHFVCTECGSVTDLEMDSIESILEVARTNFDGNIAGHVTHFYGTCGNCTKVRTKSQDQNRHITPQDHHETGKT
ncbi:MAG: transcriptional repressor [Eubacterium sp.]|nr:transcriptional repressor [Eubacterium sp.]